MMLQTVKEKMAGYLLGDDEAIGGNVLRLLKEVEEIMKASVFGKERHRSFFYPSLKSLHKAQEIMLLTADCVVDYFHSSESKTGPTLHLVTKAVKSVMKRSELARPQILTHKNTNSGLYHKVLSKCLAGILPWSFSVKGHKGGPTKSHKSAKRCALLLLALAFYNFPQIRKSILNAVRPTAERFAGKLPESSATSSEPHHGASLSSLVAAFMENEERGDENLLEAIGGWVKKLHKCQGTFYRFLAVWTRYSERLLRNAGGASWRIIEGYDVLVKALLRGVEEKQNVAKWSFGVKNAVWSVLGNEELLFPVIKLVFEKTSPYKIREVDAVLDLTVNWIKHVKARGKSPFTRGFDFSFFGAAVEVMLAQTDLFTCYKCLWMLYQVFEYFPCEEKAQLITKYLLGERFHTLFYHWSHYYRELFYAVLLYHVKAWTKREYGIEMHKELQGGIQKYRIEKDEVTVVLRAKKFYVAL